MGHKIVERDREKRRQ